jgi:Type IV secretory system Conjugative DNA transfer
MFGLQAHRVTIRQNQPGLPAPDGASRELIPLSAYELGEIKATIASPLYRRAIEARDERLIESPYPLRDTFKAASAALRVRLYHGPTPASPVFEDFPSGTVRGRRAFLDGTPSAARLLLGVPFVGQVLSNWIVDAEIRVVQRDERVLVGVQLRTTLPQGIGKGLTSKEFEGIVADLLRLRPAEEQEVPHDPIVPPGESPPRDFTGTLRDYSRCARLDELDALGRGDLPLGRYLWPVGNTRGTLPLFLGAPREASGARGEHLIFRNVCVTAPIGSGKTHSIFRPWAVAAARAGFSTLVFDPKGDLAPMLREPLFAAGSRVVVLGTSPEQPSVAWNFMDEVEIEPDGRLKSRRAVDSILDALLPEDDAVAERSAFAHQLHRGWLGGFIQIAKYALGDEADPAALYAMAREETRLRELLDLVRERWPQDVHRRLYLEVNDLFDKFEWGYAAQLRGVANALAPFMHEPLRSRTSARPGTRRFRISDLDRRPTTLILACSLQDLELGRRIGSIATALLLAHLYERRPPPPGQPDTRIPMLLLLDETRLLDANVADFLSIGRGFKAGVVTCYQELDQLRDEATRRTVLSNSNTLIALRGVGAGSRKAIGERLARATVQVQSQGYSLPEDARRSATGSSARQEVSVLGEYEMIGLPGPKHVAVVHIQDGTVPGARPFLVDLTANGEDLFKDPSTPADSELTGPNVGHVENNLLPKGSVQHREPDGRAAACQRGEP